MLRKFFGVFYTLICFFGSMLLAFGAEFLMDANCVFFGLIALSLFFLIFGIVLCVKRKINLSSFYWEIIATEIILAVLILPTGFFEKFILFRDRFHSDWGIIWVVYLIVPSFSLLLLAMISGVINLFCYLSKQKVNEKSIFLYFTRRLL